MSRQTNIQGAKAHSTPARILAVVLAVLLGTTFSLGIFPASSTAETVPQNVSETINPASTIASNALTTHTAAATTAHDPIGAGINAALMQLCNYSVREGQSVLETQADMVGNTLAQTPKHAVHDDAAVTSPSARQAAPAPAPNTINVSGDVLSFVDAYLATTAPQSGAGLWMGSASTTDGSWGYFIGHNPGPFHRVMQLRQGDAITVTDAAGLSRTYHVVDAFTVPDTTYWEEIEGRVTGYGESIIVQTCCGDNANYRVVVAV